MAGHIPEWLADYDDPRDHYLARMEWAGNSREIAVQHLNRPQNALTVMLGDPRAGAAVSIVASFSLRPLSL